MHLTDTGPMVAEVSCQRQGAVVHVLLRHGQRMNAMTRSMWRQLREVFVQLQLDAGVRVVLVRGDGQHFCAGGDIAEYADFRFHEDSLRQFHEEDVWGGLSAMLECDVPIVAQIEGNCMGAGVEIASCCDLRLAASTARFGAPIAKLGFPMAPREAALVARVAGEMTAREMLLAAQVLDTPTMAQRGFLHRVLSAEQLGTEVEHLCARMSELAPQAARMNKRTLRALGQHGPAALAQLLLAAYAYADSREHREGVSAFMEKRAPVFPDHRHDT
ncbi:MAG: enoyl-CoA hydratase-related protein [Comamonadaceae bacterium]|jgi:enoyl-CoA hydratase/carnithine racemase|nr:enoyl-CoA hydratase-related protein [Comamonadaceae bacterium]